MKYFLAIDIGASSGRHIVGYKENEEIKTIEVYRFLNGVINKGGHYIWDIDNLLYEVKKGIEIALKSYEITSLSIDTWGVDYVLLNGEKTIYPVYAYRDDRTREIIDEVHAKMSFKELYERTGCQFQPFNSLYQLYSDLKNNRLKEATDFLMIPEYLIYRLTGNKIHEFTNATTTGLISAKTLDYDYEIIDRLNLPRNLFKKLSMPKTIVGEYKGIKIVLCTTHDTACAVEGIPMIGNELYISSGTWSLLGVKTEKPITSLASLKANYSNEGGPNYNRYQKNIMGMWIVNELKKELFANEDISSIVEKCSKLEFTETVDVNDDDFLSPISMKKSFDLHLKQPPIDKYAYFTCAYRSLALSYRKAIEELETIVNAKYKKIYIVGGGAKNDYLNNLTMTYCKKEVIALPIEVTAIGNLKIQMEVEYD